MAKGNDEIAADILIAVIGRLSENQAAQVVGKPDAIATAYNTILKGINQG